MKLATATICTASTIGILMPPSLGFIVYGMITITSIGKLFMTGASVTTRTNMAKMAAANLIAGLQGQIPPNCVNPEVIKARPSIEADKA